MQPILVLCTAIFSALVPSAQAMQIYVNTGVVTTIPKIIAGVINILLAWSGFVTTALFLYGAILMVGSGGSDEWLTQGKRIMWASLIGLAIILASWMIVSTAVFFLAG